MVEMLSPRPTRHGEIKRFNLDVKENEMERVEKHYLGDLKLLIPILPQFWHD